MIGLLEQLHNWKCRRDDKEWKRGYDWAAGAILRGEHTVQDLFIQAIMPDPFDRGVQAAIRRLVALRVETITW